MSEEDKAIKEKIDAKNCPENHSHKKKFAAQVQAQMEASVAEAASLASKDAVAKKLAVKKMAPAAVQSTV